MARIRTIKPEFWDSPGTASASLRIRLLYIAMWNWADDHGRGTANAAQLLSFAFPNDAELPSLVAEFPRVCTEVSDAFGVVWYEAAGRPFYAIPSWNEHQKNERKATSKYPPPPEGITPSQRPKWAGGTEMRGNSVQTRGGSVPGTGEQGNRGTGEPTDLPDPDGPSDTDPLAHITESDFPDTFTPLYSSAFEKWWESYPRKTGKRKAFTAWKAARKRATDQELIDGAIRYATDPNRTDQFTKYPEGWLNRDGWLDEPIPAPHNGRPQSTADQRVAQIQALKSQPASRLELS